MLIRLHCKQYFSSLKILQTRNMQIHKCFARTYENIPVIILTFTPRFSALLMVSALSCLGGSKRGMRPINCQGPPELSLVPSGTSCINIQQKLVTQTGREISKKHLQTDITDRITIPGMLQQEILTPSQRTYQ